MENPGRPRGAVDLPPYDQDHLPSGGSLRRSDLQSFNRRVRKEIGPFRFLACGEYGHTTGRAHYHSILFGLDLPDVYKSGSHFVSPMLRSAWGNGQIALHPANPASIAYVSGYVVKKLRSEHRVKPTMVTVDPSGLVVSEEEVNGEFLQASNKKGLGNAWIEQHAEQVLETGFIVIKEKPCYVIPDYYMKFLRTLDGFPEFQERRIDHLSETPPLSPEDLRELGLASERDLARRMRDGV
jgi:hypothetical protein